MKAEKENRFNKKNILNFTKGKVRYALYYNRVLYYFLPKHIREQYEYRLYRVSTKNPTCLDKGSCIVCGCQTPALFFADKGCEGGCYTPMKSKEEWEKITKDGYVAE